MLLHTRVYAAVQRTCGWEDVLDEYKDGLLRAELDAPPDHVHELSHSEVPRHEVLFLVNVGDVGLLGLLDNHRDTVRVTLPDPLGLGDTLVCVWVLK